MVFSLIIWGEDSAAEGAILLKSILMYTSGPVDIHIICNEEAQVYLEKRLALVKRPRYNILFRFYRPTWQDMLDRIEREGTIHTSHAAGTPGLMKLFIHEILPPSVKKAVFVDTDAYFISDPYLLWDHFQHTLPSTTVISMPTHPEMFAPQWFDANKICSCVMLLDLEALRRLRLMDSSYYRSATPRLPAYAPPAFRALFGPPNEQSGKYEEIALGDQTFWWAIIKYMNSEEEAEKGMFAHLHYDWEISSCLADMYITDMLPGQDDVTEEDELKIQSHTWATPHQGEVIRPKLVHFNCLPGPRYYEWPGWDSAEDDKTAGTEGLALRWGSSIKYHLGYKWLWLNRGAARPGVTEERGPQVTIETLMNIKFADQLVGEQSSRTPIH
ncbi:hypothetical protein BC629DRAFT_1292706 [Irpex lacteus]|nr:hypothetical protein BC629DRAFT_1292706 [Irpex lacteus]